jgi:hypothetical protein
VGAGGPLEVVNATLYNAPTTWSDTLDLAAMVAKAAAFTGSTAKVITWSGHAFTPAGVAFVESQLLLWICTATPGSPETVYGVYYDDGALLLGLDAFDAPVQIAQALDSVQWVASAP